MSELKTLEFRGDALWLLDQTRLPQETVLLECREVAQVCAAIQQLRIRGAPAIGLAAAYGTVLAARSLASAGSQGSGFFADLAGAMEQLRSTRPTAVNLSWALARMRDVIAAHEDHSAATIAEALLAEADRMLVEDETVNRRMGEHGADLVPDGGSVLTHCNTGALATGAYGTALGAIRAAHEQGKRLHVWVDETRPLLQGARLTAWELDQLGVPFTLITDGMAAHFMARGEVDVVMVGADRIAANGDTANKIGTYGVAVLARAHELPFYVVAPTSTVDMSIASGAEIPIEHRRPEEVRELGGRRIAPDGARVANPAFDVTPSDLIAGIVTERGVVRAPYEDGLRRITRDVERARAETVRTPT